MDTKVRYREPLAPPIYLPISQFCVFQRKAGQLTEYKNGPGQTGKSWALDKFRSRKRLEGIVKMLRSGLGGLSPCRIQEDFATCLAMDDVIKLMMSFDKEYFTVWVEAFDGSEPLTRDLIDKGRDIMRQVCANVLNSGYYYYSMSPGFVA